MGLLLGGCQTKHHVDKTMDFMPASVTPRRSSTPVGSFDGADRSLLDQHRDSVELPRDENYELPSDAKRIVTTLLRHAAKDDLDRALTMFTRQARWGRPDRREYEARPILGADGGRASLEVLRNVAARFAADENLTCPPIMPAATVYVRNGAEPMWCFYISNDNLDIMAFKLIQEAAQAKIDYVGMHEVRPVGSMNAPGPLPPPMTPNLRRDEKPPRRIPPGLERGGSHVDGDGPLAPEPAKADSNTLAFGGLVLDTRMIPASPPASK